MKRYRFERQLSIIIGYKYETCEAYAENEEELLEKIENMEFDVLDSEYDLPDAEELSINIIDEEEI